MEEIDRMQKHLLLIRRAVGWSADEFGDKIGVTRQTINNIESGRNKLTKTQYIAMRSVLDAEIVRSPSDTEMLRDLLEILVDNPSKYSKDAKEQLISKATMIAPSILSKSSSRKEVSQEWIKTTRTIGIVITSALKLATPMIASWLLTVMNNSKNGKEE